MTADLRRTYLLLLDAYGPQGWWPLTTHKGCNPTKSGACEGYHPADYSFPHTDAERFEICVGAILTQNTNWENVEKAIINLASLQALDAKKMLRLTDEELKQAIRPAGYYNQKAKKLRIFAEFYLSMKDRTPPSRDELLALWGIGPETADSMLLYAYGVPVFVIDTYTRRLLGSSGIADAKADYDELQRLFHSQLPADLDMYNEFHALIVEHAKRLAAPDKKKPAALHLNKRRVSAGA